MDSREIVESREIARRARDAGVRLVMFAYCDNSGIIRGKATHISGLERRLESGIGVTTAMQAMGDMDRLQTVNGMGPVGEFRTVPDLDTFTILPYASKRALVLTDMVTMDQNPWAACPRHFLKRMLTRAESMGLTFQAAFEPEWYLALRDGDSFVPMDESLDNSTLGATIAQTVIDDIVAALEAQGLQIEQYHTEVGHGQQELSITHSDALRAADNHIIYRETVRNVAWQHGWLASFAPKPFPDQAGNGNHTHLSAWDTAGQRNLFYDPNDALQLSDLAYHFIAGIMEHLPALVLLTSPSMNSYRRISPGSWSTAYICYGPDNREAAVRVPSRFWGAEMESTNLEFRPADSSSNPYIALAGLIAAGLDGIRRGLMPADGLCIDVDPASLSPDELATRGIKRLPSTLLEAIHELEADTTLTDAMGPLLADSYLVMRKADWELFSQHDMDFEIRHHFYKY